MALGDDKLSVFRVSFKDELQCSIDDPMLVLNLRTTGI